MINKYQRMRELRAEDLNGRRSDNELERQVDVEVLQERIFHLQPGDNLEEVRDILSRIVDLLEKAS